MYSSEFIFDFRFRKRSIAMISEKILEHFLEDEFIDGNSGETMKKNFRNIERKLSEFIMCYKTNGDNEIACIFSIKHSMMPEAFVYLIRWLDSITIYHKVYDAEAEQYYIIGNTMIDLSQINQNIVKGYSFASMAEDINFSEHDISVTINCHNKSFELEKLTMEQLDARLK